MLSFTHQQILVWVSAFIWPFCRIIGLLSVAPIFGNGSVPGRVKIGLSIAITIVVVPVITNNVVVDPYSLNGALVLCREFVIGISMGFAMRLIFSAIEYSGEIMGYTMGFGFATFFDPSTKGYSSATSQFLVILLYLLFLATDMHLILLEALVHSFSTLPVSMEPFRANAFLSLVNWAGTVFTMALQISMPIIAALLITNLALGILTKSAPQLNLFGIGFPILIMTGFTIILLLLPFMIPVFTRWLETGMQFMAAVPSML